MRINSVAKTKGVKIGPPVQEYPGEGTKVRRVFDKLMDNKMQPVKFDDLGIERRHVRNIVRDLIDIYGMEIHRVATQTYMVVGEWVGDTFVDFADGQTEIR
jgi:hypothetical protein